jgi:hypothetical protein
MGAFLGRQGTALNPTQPKPRFFFSLTTARLDHGKNLPEPVPASRGNQTPGKMASVQVGLNKAFHRMGR